MSDDDVPRILDPDELSRWFINRGGPVTREELVIANARVGRNNTPYLLLELDTYGGSDIIDGGVLPFAVTEAWESAEHPESCAEPGMWLWLFHQCGYIVNGESAPRRRPRKPKTLYRGAIPERRDGMGWTDDLDTARFFARRFNDTLSTNGQVWTATFRPHQLLAYLHDPVRGRGEHEYVVDPSALDHVEITEYGRD